MPGGRGRDAHAHKDRQGQIQFNWGDIADPTAYHIYQSLSASDPYFPQQDTTVPLSPASGVSGAVSPMPTGNLVFFLVAGDSTVPTFCEGPKR